MDQCDAVIVNFNAGGFLRDAVESLLQSASVARVYIVDNASDDASLAFLELTQTGRVTVIRNTANIGFAAACNVGLARSTSESVLLLNPDCRVLEGAVEYLIKWLRSDARVGMVGPLLLNPDGSEQAGGRRKFPMPRLVIERAIAATWLGQYLPTRRGPFSEPLPSQAAAVEAISGACMMVRRASATAVGPLDEGYFLHCEDLDWCMRFHQQGWRVLFVPEARVIHVKGVSSRRRPLAAEYHKHRGMI